MSRFLPASFIASLLILAFIVPAALFTSPQAAYAQQPPNPASVPTAGSGFNDFIQTVKSILTQVQGYTTMVAAVANDINTYVLQPLAFVMSGQLMKALTASVMQFVIGKANGTGIPQFVTDVRKSLQSISDFQAEAYFRQVSLTDSPFASSIERALRIDYRQKMTLAGYWAKNMSTLGQGIPSYQPGFLTGNWGQGGVAAWFQLTTQSQNNPYFIYQNSREQLAATIGPGVGGATGARLQELNWGQGFMSWCSTSGPEARTAAEASTAYNACIAQNIPEADCRGIIGQTAGGSAPINPGDPCTDRNGNPGITQTPGSTIKATFDKILGGQQDKLVQMGNISSQVNSILGNIGTVLNTINLAANILGGTSSGGLLNAGSPTGALTTWGTARQAPPVDPATLNYYGTGGTQIARDSENSAVTAATRVSTSTNLTPADFGLGGATGGTDSTSSSGMLARIGKYETAWNTIGSAAQTTSSALQTTITACRAYFGGSTSYDTNAQNALTTIVNPIITHANGVSALMSAARTQNTLVAGLSATSTSYTTELQRLNTMPPTGGDVATAEYNASAYGGAVANPAGSLNVSGGSMVDQMNLLKTNADNIKNNQCTARESGA